MSTEPHPSNLSPKHWFVLFGLCVFALVLKSPDAYANPQFWAEDAVIFFRQQWNHDWPQVATPYAGYSHFVPRLIAWLASFFPIESAPRLYSMAALGIASASISYFLWKLASTPLSIIAFAGIFLAPTNGEVFGTLTNSQWFIQFLLAAACFFPRSLPGTRHRWLMVALVLACALTGPFSSLLIVLHAGLLVTAYTGRSFRPLVWMNSYLSSLDPWRLGALWAGGGMQIAIAQFASHQPVVEVSLYTMLSAIGGMSQTHTFGLRILPARVFLVALCALPLFLFRDNLPSRHKGFLLVSWSFALLQIAAGSIKPGLMAEQLGVGDRYFVLFKPMFWLLAYQALVAVPRSGRTRMLYVIMLCISLVAIKNRDHLQRAPLPNKQWAEAVRTLPEDRDAVIDVNPSWKLVLPPRK